MDSDLPPPDVSTAADQLNRLLTDDRNAENQLILTPNQPLAQQLRRRRLNLTGRRTFSEQATRCSEVDLFNRWLNASIAENAEKPLATEVQLRWLMELALKKSLSDHPQLNPTFLAANALSAWRNLKRYRVPYTELKKSEIGQEAYFHDTVVEMDRLLDKSPVCCLETEITRQINDTELTSDSHTNVFLYGFLTTPPPLCMDWVKHQFNEVFEIPFSNTNAGHNACSVAYPATDETDEFESAIQWASRILADNAQARIGIIRQNLDANQRRSQRLLTTGLPKQFRSSSALKPPASEVGTIHSALLLLQMNRFEITWAQARELIHSPHWGVPSDYQARADWDTKLCDTQLRYLSLADIRACVDRPLSEAHQRLSDQLIAFEQIRRRASKLHTPAQWAPLFCQQLEALGWPNRGAATDNDSGQRDIALWFDLLQDFSACTGVTGSLGLSDALTLLQQICDQQRTDPGAAHVGVRLLDTVEAAADYTHIWLMGVDQTNWPAPPTPNPLLAVSLQRKYRMPSADPALETDLARKLLHRLEIVADQVVFSYSNSDEGQATAISNLVPKDIDRLVLPPRNSRAAKPQPALPSELSAEPVFEWIDTSTAPVLAVSERQVRGGASLLKQMATSPFNAFANFRLFVTPLKKPKIGLDALDRGNLVHFLMENIWRQLQHQSALQDLNGDQRDQLCLSSADAAVRHWESKRSLSTPLSAPLRQLEIQRLSRLATRWLDVEAQREAFSVIGLEQELTAEIGGLTFKLRMDRIDQLTDGSIVLLDYKTSKALSANAWKEDPPKEPQLPLYAVTLDDQPEAIGFVQLTATHAKLIGIGAVGGAGIKRLDDWDDQLNRWRTSLSNLAASYANGDARVFIDQKTGIDRDPLIPLHRSLEAGDLSDGE